MPRYGKQGRVKMPGASAREGRSTPEMSARYFLLTVMCWIKLRKTLVSTTTRVGKTLEVNVSGKYKCLFILWGQLGVAPCLPQLNVVPTTQVKRWTHRCPTWSMCGSNVSIKRRTYITIETLNPHKPHVAHVLLHVSATVYLADLIFFTLCIIPLLVPPPLPKACWALVCRGRQANRSWSHLHFIFSKRSTRNKNAASSSSDRLWGNHLPLITLLYTVLVIEYQKIFCARSISRDQYLRDHVICVWHDWHVAFARASRNMRHETRAPVRTSRYAHYRIMCFADGDIWSYVERTHSLSHACTLSQLFEDYKWYRI